mmetsp:Transcript_4744/g.8393  ORF Transcript_4744/g.8393 Transcript_4744/m.8393 type:complete len:464 (-) Transcript_4744:87-1478(-)
MHNFTARLQPGSLENFDRKADEGSTGSFDAAGLLAAGARNVLEVRRASQKWIKAWDETAQNISTQANEASAAVDKQLGISATLKDRVEAAKQTVESGGYLNLADRAVLLSEDLAEEWTAFKAKRDVAAQNFRSDVHKVALQAVSNTLGKPRRLTAVLDPLALGFYDAAVLPGVSGCVALTIDDGPCSSRNPEDSMLKDAKKLLSEFNATATFFLCTDYVKGHEDGLIELLRNGSEIANHCQADQSYGSFSEEDFRCAFLEAEGICEELRQQAKHLSGREDGTETSAERDASSSTRNFGQQPQQKGRVEKISTCDATRVSDAGAEGASSSRSSKADSEVASPSETGLMLPPLPARWFRAPHADTSPEMQKVLSEYGFTNVLCDAFANDTMINDASFIAEALLDMVDPAGGSIIVIHMPEHGFREHNLQALELLLRGLREREMRVMSVSELTELAWLGQKSAKDV